MAAFTSMDGLLIGLRKFVWNSLLRVPWLIAYNVGGATILVGFFAFTSQGQDILRISAERGFVVGDLSILWNLAFLIGTLLASLSFWYSSRLQLGRDYPGYPLDPKYAAFGRRWWPRLLGVAVPVAIGWTFRRIGSEAHSIETLLSWLYLGMAALLLLFYMLRRALFRVGREYMIKDLPEDLPPADRRRIRAYLLASFVLLALFVAVPVYLPQWIGAPAIAVLGVAGISLFGSGILTYLPMARGVPAATLLALLLAWVFGFWNDNHAVRVADNAGAPVERRTPAEQFAAWQQAEPTANGGAAPVILVTASGGGIRAAYWTASTLAYLEQKLGAAFYDRLFAISGVSGGSVGAAAYVTLKRAQLDSSQPGSLLAPVREVLGHDFLSPVVAGMLFPDLVQRFFPIPVALADRQRFLERSWEVAFTDPGRDLFRGPFKALYSGPTADRLPSLLLNTTVVETGERAIVSNLKVDGLPQVIDLLDPRYQLTDIRTSAAAGASARFTYVSPAGTVDIADGEHIRLVDGGYFENSGAASMTDLLAALHDSGASIKPILMLIRNDPTAPNLCRRDGGGAQPTGGDRFNSTVSEVTAPIEALLETRSARGWLAEVKAARLVEAMGGAVIEVPLAAVLQTRLNDVGPDAKTRAEVKSRYVEPPLGWSLSKEVQMGMNDTLDSESGGLAQQFRYLSMALGLEAGSVPGCDPL
jgi:hypothetical protein